MKGSDNVMREISSFQKLLEDGKGVVMEHNRTVSRFCWEGPDAQWPVFLRS